MISKKEDTIVPSIGTIQREVTTKDRQVLVTPASSPSPSPLPSPGESTTALPPSPSLPARDSCLDLIDKTVGNDSWQVSISKVSPTQQDIGVLPYSMTVIQIRKFLLDKYGAGRYLISLLRDGSELKGTEARTTILVGSVPSTVETQEEGTTLRHKKQRTQEMSEELKQKNAEVDLAKREMELKKIREDISPTTHTDEKLSFVEQLAILTTALSPLLTAIIQSKAQQPAQINPLEQFVRLQEMKAQNEKNLVELILSKKLDTPDPTKLLLETQAQTKIEMWEMFDRLERLQSHKGSTIFDIIERLVEGIAENIPSITTAIQQRFNKPAKQLTDSELIEYAREIKKRQQLVLSAPTPKPEVEPEAKPVPKQALEQDQTQPSPEPIVPSVEQPQSNGIDSLTQAELDDLEEQINNAVETMLVDVTSGRNYNGQHLWIEEALNTWHQEFKNVLVNIPGKMDRLKLIREKTSKHDLWDSIDIALKTESEKKTNETAKVVVYNNFYNSFEVFVQYYRQVNA